MKPLRIGSSFQGAISQLDPSRITTLYEYEIIENIYGRLIKFDPDGRIVADVPDEFSWSDNNIIFRFGTKVKTKGGIPITAEDAAISLKRLILLKGSGHGDIRRFLCPDFHLKSLNQSCPGITTQDSKLILTVGKADYIPHLITTLDSADYSIIPKDFINFENGDLSPEVYTETSGPYYVHQDSHLSKITFRANPNHYIHHASRDTPQEIILAQREDESPLDQFLNGKIDVLTTSTYFTGPSATKILADDRFSVHETVPIRILMMRFSENGLRDFSSSQRMYLGLKAGLAFTKHFAPVGAKDTVQFFQELSEGSLGSERLDQVASFRSITPVGPSKRKMRYGVPKVHFDVLKKELQDITDIEVVSLEAHPASLPPERRPDIYYVATDSTWSESLSLLGYNFRIGTFSKEGLDSEKWLQTYLNTPLKADRIRMLERLHFDLLMNASFIPLLASPYYAAAHAGIQLNQSQTTTGVYWWMLKRN